MVKKAFLGVSALLATLSIGSQLSAQRAQGTGGKPAGNLPGTFTFVPKVDVEKVEPWNSRGHFFAAAAEAMRRILVERARSRATLKRGGKGQRLALDQIELACDDRAHELLALDEALGELERHEAQAAQLVKLRYYGGCTHQQAAEALGISRRAADRLWVLARTWLYQQVNEK